MFKAFLSLTDPRIISKPNIRETMTWMNYIFHMAWLLGVAIAIDEMTLGFQGHHKHKKCITPKAEGDRFQADALAQEGYCFQFYTRNDPPPKKSSWSSDGTF
jgi:hypothetical protein